VFAADLKKARKRLKLSQSELSKRLGMSTRTLQEWELARRTPNPFMQKLVSSALRRLKPKTR